MSSRKKVATAISVDEQFHVAYWRDEFKRLLNPVGRQWKQKIREIDTELDCNTLEAVRDGRASLEKTRRVVVALQKVEGQIEEKETRISARIKRHKLTIR